MADEREKREIDQFIHDEIDSVPHLEALLLLWNSRPRASSVDEMSHKLFVESATARQILQDLARQGLIAAVAGTPEEYRYEPGPEEKDRLVGLVDATYRRELIRVSRMIHSKAAAPVREFARAFRFTKERD